MKNSLPSKKLNPEQRRLQASLDKARKAKGTKSAHEADPKEEIRKAVNLPKEGFGLFGNQVLLGHYIRSEKTSGGVFRTDDARKEDEYQGKVGLIIAMGPLAFVDGTYIAEKFGGVKAKVGDWVFYSVRDGLPLDVNGTRCRLIEANMLLGKVPFPDMIY